MAQIDIYFKTVATIEADATEAQMRQFLATIYATSQAQTRFQAWRDSFKTAVRFVVGRPAAVAVNARVVSWHMHLENNTTVDEPEA